MNRPNVIDAAIAMRKLLAEAQPECDLRRLAYGPEEFKTLFKQYLLIEDPETWDPAISPQEIRLIETLLCYIQVTIESEAKVRAELAEARKFPDDSPERPQVTDSAALWAEYADWLERIFCAQNLARGETERDLEAARKGLRGYVRAQRRMLERWAESDDAVKACLWSSLHMCEAEHDAAIDAAMAEEEDNHE